MALSVGKFAQRLAGEYPTLVAALEVAADPRSALLAPKLEPGNMVPVGHIPGFDADGSFHFLHYLGQAADNSDIVDDLQRNWHVGTLIALGDALSERAYFDHAPELELVYHLRNGVAHGNQFNINASGRKRLQRYPAHNRDAWTRGDKRTFEVTAALNGSAVLFDFMGPADIQVLLAGVGVYLIRMGNGDPLRP